MFYTLRVITKVASMAAKITKTLPINAVAFHVLHWLDIVSCCNRKAVHSLLVIDENLSPSDQREGAEHLWLNLDRNVEVLSC